MNRITQSVGYSCCGCNFCFPEWILNLRQGIPKCWEFFGLERDPCELNNLYSNHDYIHGYREYVEVKP
jgi:hypothetical protein